MAAAHLVAQVNNPPERDRAVERAPPRSGRTGALTGAGMAAVLARLALRPSPLWHVDGTRDALPACSAGEDPLPTL